MGRKQIFADDFVFGLKEDVRADLDEFEARLKEMLGEVFNSKVPFNQTQNTDICKFCSFKDICHR
jgi:CRISPR/Cas system-associated exonuclease Cas4 (RecB family)